VKGVSTIGVGLETSDAGTGNTEYLSPGIHLRVSKLAIAVVFLGTKLIALA